MPVQARVVVPLGSLAELATHEKQLFAGLGELVAGKKAEIRELLPLVAGHAGEQRAFAVYDLVVRQRQDEMLAVRIDRPEGQPVGMPGAGRSKGERGGGRRASHAPSPCPTGGRGRGPPCRRAGSPPATPWTPPRSS